MVASFEEFRETHRAEHLGAFNRWCVAVGNGLILLSLAPLLARQWRSATVGALIGGAITGVGHVADRNLGRAARDLVRHPVWSVRADVGLAWEVLVGR